MPTERAHRVITASKGVVSLGEPNTTGDGLLLLQVPLPGPLTVSEAAPLQLCFTGVECFWQQRINGAGGYLSNASHYRLWSWRVWGGRALLGI